MFAPVKVPDWERGVWVAASDGMSIREMVMNNRTICTRSFMPFACGHWIINSGVRKLGGFAGFLQKLA